MFYNGQGQDGIWYTSYDGNTWSGKALGPVKGPKSTGDDKSMPVADETNPCPVVVGDRLYVFFNSPDDQGGNFGSICYTSGSKGIDQWQPVTSLKQQLVDVSNTGHHEVLPKTSPTATVHEGQIFVFWKSSTGVSAATCTPEDNQWSYLKVPALLSDVSPTKNLSAVSFDGYIHIFYNWMRENGIRRVKLTKGGRTEQSDPESVGGSGMQDSKEDSPTAFVSDDLKKLTLLWTRSDNKSIYYTEFADGSWSDQATIDAPALLPGSYACGSYLGRAQYVLWGLADPEPSGKYAANYRIWFAHKDNPLPVIPTVRQYDIDDVDFDWLKVHQAISTAEEFDLVSKSQKQLPFFQKFGVQDTVFDPADAWNVIYCLIGSVADRDFAPGFVAIVLLASTKKYTLTLRYDPNSWKVEFKPPPKPAP